MSDEAHMRRALALAAEGLGRTSPNPSVGCVLVREGRIVGEGRTQPPGGPHAEIVALREAGEAARGARCYTTLEPCDHQGRTGPCSLALIEAGVAEVIYALPDPNPLAAGGAARLRAAGVRARGGLLADEARAQLRPWLHAVAGAPRPWVTAKLAASLDGRTATRTGDSKWITGEAARARGHELRQRSDAVMVGVGTVLADDPGLDPRPEAADPAPGLKLVLDTHLRTPPTARLLRSPGPVLIACGEGAEPGARAALEAAGAEVAAFPTDGASVDLAAVLAALRARDCLCVMIEGGAALLGSAFDAGLVDEVWAFLAPVIIGGGQPAVAGQGPARLADAFRLHAVRTEALGPDILVRGLTAADAHQTSEAPCSLAS